MFVQGDSGGPIFHWTGQYWEQVGIVSYGDDCAKPGKPGIYTRLSYYHDWIHAILNREHGYIEPVVNATISIQDTTRSNDLLNRTNTAFYWLSVLGLNSFFVLCSIILRKTE